VALEVYLGHPEGVDWDVDLGGGVTLSLKWIPAGEFNMGSTAAEREWAVGAEGQGKPEFLTDERDPVRVRIARGFWLGKTEVTVGQWRRFIADTPGFQSDAEKMGKAWCAQPGQPWGLMDGKSWRDPNWWGVALRDDHPAACITWNDTLAFHAWLKRKIGDDMPIGMTARLPGEAEWEYACRGGREGTKFWWGDRLEDGRGRLNGASDDDLGNNTKSWSAKYTWSDGYAWASPVDSFGTKGRNGFGLADMLGNVWEWCYDGYDTSGPHATIWTESTSRRVVRGGSFGNLPGNLRCAGRGWSGPSRPGADLGFRVCVGSSVVSP
jgi:formylglycine-generating enzyme required for sulfatase activity